jgi:hypothetical protein
MASINTKATVLAIVEETTEGTPVIPSGTGDYTAIQDDVAMTPSFEVLENAEFKNSIGKSKPILGNEAPTFEMSHYLRASGVVATAPDYNLLLKGAFGSESIRGTERNTVASSTTTVIKVDTGEGAEFSKGDLLLIKDATNGYSVRAVESVSTDDLTIGFRVGTAPGTGVNLGRNVVYKPAASGHIPMTIWQYLGNGGATQMVSGAKVTGFSFDATAGQLINAKFTLDGIEYYFNPIQITSSTRYIDFNDGGVKVATVATGMYKDPYKLAEALQTAMDDASSDTITVTYDPTTGKFTIATNGAALSLLWNTGTNTANSIATKVGFTTAADSTSALTYTSPNAQSFASPYTPAFDSADPLAAKNHEVMIGSQSDYACFHASKITFNMANTRSVSGDICAVSGQGASLISERVIDVSVSALLQQYDSQNFKRFRAGDEIRFQYTFGTKSGSNWVEGKTGALYIGSATISEYSIDDADGLVQLNMKLNAFVNNAGDGECFLGFV